EKVEAIEGKNVDFVISKSINFRDPNRVEVLSYNENYYRFGQYKLSAYNYAVQNINWLTYDFLGKREVLKGIKFNENLHSNQEYNFFCQLTCITTNGYVIDKFLTLRRIHKDSIRGQYDQNQNRIEEYQKMLLLTWNDVAKIKPGS